MVLQVAKGRPTLQQIVVRDVRQWDYSLDVVRMYLRQPPRHGTYRFKQIRTFNVLRDECIRVRASRIQESGVSFGLRCTRTFVRGLVDPKDNVSLCNQINLRLCGVVLNLRIQC